MDAVFFSNKGKKPVIPRRTLMGHLALFAFCGTVAAAPGDLDTNFGSAGFVVTNVSTLGVRADYVYATALQPSNKVVVGGACTGSGKTDFCLVRYTANGALDTSFGSSGKVITSVSGGNDLGASVAIQRDDKILLGGYCLAGLKHDFCLVRYTSDGVLDSTFGANGIVVTQFPSPFGSDDYGQSLALQPDGKIVFAGYCNDGSLSGNTFCVARYNVNGTLDSSFGSGGLLTRVIAPAGAFGGSSIATAIAVQLDGKLVITGWCLVGSRFDFCTTRLNADGSPDVSFGDMQGNAITPIGASNANAYSTALQPDGKIVVAGVCNNFDFCVVRYETNGVLDTKFGINGKMIVDLLSMSSDTGINLALQPDGKILQAGFCQSSNYYFCVARFNSDGSLDTTFANGGKLLSSLRGGTEDVGRALALQADGKIVIAGNCKIAGSVDFCVARYEGGPFGYRNCTLDIDGDGKVTATIDSLIHARIALGITGNAVIGGIAFPSNATRKTWADIRGYLVTQCGMLLAP
jgi:uncharacterized delta-60 repeat protein